MSSAKMTAKRQVTFPKELCDDLGLKPGDRLFFERVSTKKESVWVVRSESLDYSWVGGLKKYAKEKSFDQEDIRRSIAQKFKT